MGFGLGFVVVLVWGGVGLLLVSGCVGFCVCWVSLV